MKNINQGEAEVLLNEYPNSVDSVCELANAESQAWREKFTAYLGEVLRKI